MKRYVGLVAEGRYEEALATIREDNPFAAVSGYLCHRPCEAECALGDTGSPIPVRALKRLAARVVDETGQPPAAPPCPPTRGRVAVVGGGPAGLTAARDLRRFGYEVTLFEAAARLGGLLARAVPAHRLPPWALAADLAYVLAHGIDVRLGVELRGPTALGALAGQGFDAVLVATGATRGVAAALPGAPEVVPALTLLERLCAGEAPPLFRSAAVIGAGTLGVAVATALATPGAGRVTLLHHRDLASLPVDPEALHAADHAGVVLRCGRRAEALITEGGVVTGLRLRTLTPGDGGRAGRTHLQEGVAVDLAADLVVDATARLPDLAGWPAGDVTLWGTLAADGATLSTTAHAGIFAAGEVVTGARSVIEAIAHGRRAAARVHATLAGEQPPTRGTAGGGLRLGGEGAPSQTTAWQHLPASTEDAHASPLGAARPRGEDPAGTIEPRGLAEARRCRRCGPCTECATCSPHCGEAVHVDSNGHWVRTHRDVEIQTGLPLVSIRARVDAAACRGCGLCEEHCPYGAPRVRLRPVGRLHHALVATVDPGACRGCGLCVGLCPTGALGQGGFTNRELAARIDAGLAPPAEVR